MHDSISQRGDRMSGGSMALARGRDAMHAESFDLLFSAHYDDVYGLAHALLRNAQDAEDVTQDVFLRAYKALPFYQPERATLRTTYPGGNTNT